jgi:hypothetical protein
VWGGIKKRCTKKTKRWKRYGGRGIRVCERWSGSFEAFFADMGPKPPGTTSGGIALYTIERIDNDAGYDCGKCEDCHARGVVKTNCRWATNAEQSNNRSSNRMYTLNGETLNITQWAKKIGLKEPTLRSRLDRGWDVQRALTP